jgi:hypothetical protein
MKELFPFIQGRKHESADIPSFPLGTRYNGVLQVPHHSVVRKLRREVGPDCVMFRYVRGQ